MYTADGENGKIMTIHDPNEQGDPAELPGAPVGIEPADAGQYGTAPRHAIDLFHALRIGCRKAAGWILTGSFSPDFTGGEYRVISGERMEFSFTRPGACRSRGAPEAVSGILVDGGPLSVVTVGFTAGPTAGGRVAVTDAVLAGPKLPITVRSHRGFGFACLFPMPECRFETVIEVLSRSFADELHAEPADIEDVRESLRERLTVPGAGCPKDIPGRTSPA